MRGRRAFTLVELMVVVVIVGILAAVAVPLFSGNISAAKFTEAVSAAGTIRQELALYKAEKGSYPTVASGTEPNGWDLNVTNADLGTKYFDHDDYDLVSTATSFLIVVTGGGSRADAPASGTSISLDQNGVLTKDY